MSENVEFCPGCGLNLYKRRRVDVVAGETRSERIEELLNSNDGPAGDEVDTFGRIAVDGALDLRDIDEQIERSRTYLQTLITERETLVRKVADHKRVMSPIRRLSFYELSEIFSWSVELDMKEKDVYNLFNNRHSLNSTQAPWKLAQICSFWRRTVLNQHSLWSSIKIVLEKLEKPDIAYKAILLGLYFQRSGNHPLKVHIRIKNVFRPLKPYHPLLVLFLLYCHRCQTLGLSFPSESLESLAPVTGRLHLLQDLRIALPSGERFQAKYTSLFQFAPKLTTVKVDGYPAFHNMQLPWSQILYYEWRDSSEFTDAMNNSQHLDILRLTPELQRCELDCKLSSSIDLSVELSLPHLRRLTLRSADGKDGMEQMLTVLHTPALTTLELKSDLDSLDFIVPFFSHGRFSSLEHLWIPYIHESSNVLEKILHQVPSLRALVIYNSNQISKDIFTSTDDGLPIFSFLKIITLRFSENEPIVIGVDDLAEVVDFLRRNGSLEELVIVTKQSDFFHAFESHEKVRNCIPGGLVVRGKGF